VPEPDSCRKLARALRVSSELILELAGHISPQPIPEWWEYEVLELLRQLTPQQRELLTAAIRGIVQSGLSQETCAEALGGSSRGTGK
jgi:hypothetical protein